MLCVPVPITLGVYVRSEERRVGEELSYGCAVNGSVPLLAGVIVPPGALFAPVSVSVTVAVQVIESLTGTGLEAQLIPIVVVRGRTVSAKALAVLLPAWIASVAA